MKFRAESYTGTNIGKSGFNARHGVQIVATDDNGTRRAIFKTTRGKTPCLKLWEGAAHYKTGLNKADGKRFQEEMARAERLAAKWNKAGNPDKEYLA